MSVARDLTNDCAQCCWVGLKMLWKRTMGHKKIRMGYAPETIDEGKTRGESKVNALVVALDYPGTGAELTCTADAKNIMTLLTSCGVYDATTLFNNDANLDNVIAAIRRVGRSCNPGDYFVFFYAGHGTSVKDTSGDEEDGKDEAFCLVTPSGKIDYGKFLIDDTFAEEVTASCTDGVNILVLSDCCHSGTISDFDQPCWGQKEAISMSGCTDTQTSGDTGKGGIFTHSLLMAIEDLQKQEDTTEYSVGKVYNRTLYYDNTVFNSAQDISMGWSDACGPTAMAWPLIPTEPYTAPWRR